MNDVLSLINMEIQGEEDKRGSWKVKEARTLFRYYDGMVRSLFNLRIDQTTLDLRTFVI